ncbi:hypothetical protein DB88DRAFT_488948 [Papiliotrema laurentii]|uniref:Uncharacterized protein n=1 Tax=Papiliotrema laurentii TaxID=5418 RepID=A0AAD9D0Z4_PAPLA|nr:hypothetical protein DB88DRAFT_488948 [Papiliotrema laurentii]
MPEPRRPSSSSYAPVFINPSRPVEAGPTAVETVPHGPARVKLRYPWPLFLFSMCDLVSTGYHAYKGDIDREIIAVCLGRGIVLGLVLGLSRQWRSRGGWVALGCVISVGMAVWTVCKAQLEGGKRGDDERGHVPILFLAITALLGMLEYTLFLLLLRLSPPPHRSHPLALRAPPYALQCPTAFPFDTQSIPSEYEPSSPTTSRHAHRRQHSRNALLGTTSPRPQPLGPEGGEGYAYENDEYDYEGYDPESGDYSSDTSSVSESSIIDLPPPLSPARIAPPVNVGVHSLDIFAAIDGSPVFGAVGAVVRRTKSARFLGRSWGSRQEEREPDSPGGYGTFGGDDSGDRSVG